MSLPRSPTFESKPTGDDRSLQPLDYVYSESLAELLHQMQCTLVVTTYQSGKLAVFRARRGRLSLLPRTFPQPMGVAVSRERWAVGTLHQVWVLENNTDLAQSINQEAGHDACYLPRQAYVTGNIHVHEMAWGQTKASGDHADLVGSPPTEPLALSHDLWIVNTLFSCLCRLDPHYSFIPLWRPPFVTKISAEDRCHLNGLAMADGRPAMVTAFAETDTPGGWRDNAATTGCVIDVASGVTITRNLAMPHSPRISGGNLFVLDSGNGSLVRVDIPSGRPDCVVRLPGYTRGLAIHGDHAFVGLSRIRAETTFDHVPIAQERDTLKCGVWVVDLRTAAIEGFLEFTADVTEIFDVQLLPGVRNPHVVGLEKETIQTTFVVPRGMS